MEFVLSQAQLKKFISQQFEENLVVRMTDERTYLDAGIAASVGDIQGAYTEGDRVFIVCADETPMQAFERAATKIPCFAGRKKTVSKIETT